MPILALKVPDQVACDLGRFSVPGDRTPDNEKHVTIVHFDDDMSLDDIGKVVIRVARLTETLRPFFCTLTTVTSFPPGNGKHPVICPVSSLELHGVHEALVEAMDDIGVGFSKKFPDYKPHVTLSFSPVSVTPTKMNDVSWLADKLVLWTGEHGDEKLSVTFDLLG